MRRLSRLGASSTWTLSPSAARLCAFLNFHTSSSQTARHGARGRAATPSRPGGVCPTYSTDPLNTLDREPSLNLQTSDGMRMNGDPSYGSGFLCLSKNCTIYAPICGSGGRLNKGSSEPSVGKYRIPFVTLVPKRIHWALSL